MFNFDRIVRVATASVGALVLSSLTLVAAAGPAASAAQGRTIIAQVQVQDLAHG